MLYTETTSSWCLLFPGCAGLDLPLTSDLPGLKHGTYPSYKNRPSPPDLQSTAHSDPPQLRRGKNNSSTQYCYVDIQKDQKMYCKYTIELHHDTN